MVAVHYFFTTENVTLHLTFSFSFSVKVSETSILFPLVTFYFSFSNTFLITSVTTSISASDFSLPVTPHRNPALGVNTERISSHPEMHWPVGLSDSKDL